MLKQTPPWKLLTPEINTSVSELKKTEPNPLVFKPNLAEFKDSTQTGIEIYTDGSKDKIKVAAGATKAKPALGPNCTIAYIKKGV